MPISPLHLPQASHPSRMWGKGTFAENNLTASVWAMKVWAMKVHSILDDPESTEHLLGSRPCAKSSYVHLLYNSIIKTTKWGECDYNLHLFFILVTF